MAKIFAVAKQPQEFHGIMIPAGAIYGRTTLNYSVKVPTGKTRQIYDKDGYPLFHEDGSPVTRDVLRIEQRTETFIYAITNFNRVKFKDGMYYRAWVMIPRNEYAKMHERVLCETAGLRELQKFIMQKILKSGINYFKMDVQEIGQNGKIHKMAQSAAPRRKVQTADDMPFRGHACYALNPNIMTDGVRPKDAMQKSVIASHKDGFGTKPVYDPAKASVEDARIPKFGYTAEGVRVIFPKKSMAHDTAVSHGNGHYVAGNGAELARTQNEGKDLHDVAVVEYWDKPRKTAKPEFKGKEPTFRKVVETPTGIRRFYNEQEYNDYISAQAVVDAHKPAPKKRKVKNIIIVTQAR